MAGGVIIVPDFRWRQDAWIDGYLVKCSRKTLQIRLRWYEG
jgi:hypothetical protein